MLQNSKLKFFYFCNLMVYLCNRGLLYSWFIVLKIRQICVKWQNKTQPLEGRVQNYWTFRIKGYTLLFTWISVSKWKIVFLRFTGYALTRTVSYTYSSHSTFYRYPTGLYFLLVIPYFIRNIYIYTYTEIHRYIFTNEVRTPLAIFTKTFTNQVNQLLI